MKRRTYGYLWDPCARVGREGLQGPSPRVIRPSFPGASGEAGQAAVRLGGTAIRRPVAVRAGPGPEDRTAGRSVGRARAGRGAFGRCAGRRSTRARARGSGGRRGYGPVRASRPGDRHAASAAGAAVVRAAAVVRPVRTFGLAPAAGARTVVEAAGPASAGAPGTRDREPLRKQSCRMIVPRSDGGGGSGTGARMGRTARSGFGGAPGSRRRPGSGLAASRRTAVLGGPGRAGRPNRAGVRPVPGRRGVLGPPGQGCPGVVPRGARDPPRPRRCHRRGAAGPGPDVRGVAGPGRRGAPASGRPQPVGRPGRVGRTSDQTSLRISPRTR
jgi:hypothetical protein